MFNKNLRLMVVGSSQCGKSTFIKNLLRWKSEVCPGNYNHVIFAAPTLGSSYLAEEAALMEEIRQCAAPAEVHFMDRIPTISEMTEHIDHSDNRTLVICDDFGEALWNSVDISTAVTRLSSHMKTDIVMTNHSCFGSGKYYGSIWKNCNTVIIFKCLSDASMSIYLQRKLFPGKKNIIDLAFSKVHEYCGYYGYLVLQYGIDNPLNHRFLMSCRPLPYRDVQGEWKLQPIYLGWKDGL